MSDYGNQVVPSSGPFPYNVITSQYSPATTVAINLRQFEKDAKAQAEREYDAEHGPLPEPPADDDTSIDLTTRIIQKKKRKVRSAIVSRRKSAIYVEKLEADLEMRDDVNRDLKTRLGVFRDVLRETTSRIHALQRALDVRKDVQKRGRNPNSTGADLNQVSSTDNPGLFFLEEDPIDDILSISPEEILPGYGPPKAENVIGRAPDFSSECSDAQTSPVAPRSHRFEQPVRQFPAISLKDDSTWKAPLHLPHKPLFSQHLPFRGPLPM